ncbi:hypothetical protein AGOR_G00188840 [Albula goreensis]|uniref:Uncharacterized protein n=1 Tax=Albula goreensis TaxID=1534307 RepID=A0A8T3CU99_9TELE|nr:hypothetical protein AGOR_G00188840 [Albula goreensis]
MQNLIRYLKQHIPDFISALRTESGCGRIKYRELYKVCWQLSVPSSQSWTASHTLLFRFLAQVYVDLQ